VKNTLKPNPNKNLKRFPRPPKSKRKSKNFNPTKNQEKDLVKIAKTTLTLTIRIKIEGTGVMIMIDPVLLISKMKEDLIKTKGQIFLRLVRVMTMEKIINKLILPVKNSCMTLRVVRWLTQRITPTTKKLKNIPHWKLRPHSGP
jgi:hypothetical protein